MGEIRQRVNAEARSFGIEVTDVRIRRADLPEENTQAILSRMQSERERVAREQRAEGAEQAQRIRATAERDRTVLIAEAQSRAETLRGEGEQLAIRIFAEAYQKDPEFYQFWRTMQPGGSLRGWRTRLLLSPDSDFFKYFRNLSPGGAGGGALAGAASRGARGPAAAGSDRRLARWPAPPI